jgi:hypothetical protein
MEIKTSIWLLSSLTKSPLITDIRRSWQRGLGDCRAVPSKPRHTGLNRANYFSVVAGFAQRPLLPPLSAGSAIGKDGFIQIPITQQAWFARATERIAVRTSRAGAPREIARENDQERDCGSNNISR